MWVCMRPPRLKMPLVHASASFEDAAWLHMVVLCMLRPRATSFWAMSALTGSQHSSKWRANS
eukprot:8039384-Prorocentrum_lima.AAC.1